MEFHRQLSIFNPAEHNTSVLLVGAGAIGSMTALNLTKMGIDHISVMDMDIVEEHNLPNQFYPVDTIDTPKTEALKTVIQSFTNTEIEIIPDIMCNETKINHNIVITATDNMTSRMIAFEKAKTAEFFIDARMGGQNMRIYTIRMSDPKQVEYYRTKLYTDDEADEEPCTARSIIYNVSIISGIVANQLKRALSGETFYNGIVLDLTNMNMVKQKA